VTTTERRHDASTPDRRSADLGRYPSAGVAARNPLFEEAQLGKGIGGRDAAEIEPELARPLFDSGARYHQKF
jgi:hypothetical protein